MGSGKDEMLSKLQSSVGRGGGLSRISTWSWNFSECFATLLLIRNINKALFKSKEKKSQLESSGEGIYFEVLFNESIL